MKKFNPRYLPEDATPARLARTLSKHGCDGCGLGSQPRLHGPVLYRGSQTADLMFVGFGPGKLEDLHQRPFYEEAPAGKILQGMIRYMGLSENDYIITNVVCCRPIAPKGSGKENRDPTPEEIKACSVYLEHLIKHVKPKVIVMIGEIPINYFFPELKGKAKRLKVGNVVNKIHLSKDRPDIVFTAIYHPAYLARQKSMDPVKYRKLRQDTVELLDKVKEILEEMN